MPWQQLTIATSKEFAPHVETLIENLGSLSVTMTDGADQPIYEPPLETTPLWQQVLVTGLFEEQHDLSQVEQYFNQHLNSANDWQITIEQLEDQVWERVWLENFHPIKFGENFWVCSTEHETPDANATILRLDPGLAFGTGTHPTTALCLEWLANNSLDDCKIIDFGCGSGILAIAALLLGAKHAIGIDIDPQALTATNNNATQNNVLDKIQVYDEKHYPRDAKTIVIANILAEPLITLADEISSLVQTNGHLLLSGILSEQADQVMQAYQPRFVFDSPVIKDGWACLHATKLG
ncbi:MAG TPA: 50S ribosomal protein L11 methyltransferase [Cycloclasticus sp.]|jgi:ribosomal protein L11 methyltransferase|nr:50S ribosomal protein L11 methyltransferase [Cycloclasticus sp.]HIL91162.1 50S ribosomal protein L11 methyltransferase [Cycloclasticus sp.]